MNEKMLSRKFMKNTLSTKEEIKDIEYMFNSYHQLLSDSLEITINLFLEKEIEMLGEYSLESFSKNVTTDQIEKIINLLHNEYNNLGTDIKVYSNYFQLIRGIFKDNQSTFSKIRRSIRDTKDFIKIGGYYDPPLNKVVILEHLFFLLPKEERKLYFVNILFHELRHNWQQKYKKFQRTDNDTPYHERLEERDANLFAMRMMNKYKKEINEILNLNVLKWEVHYKKIKIKNSQ